MRIKLLKPFGFSEPGDILNPDPPVAQLLIDRGVAVAAPSANSQQAAFRQNKSVNPGRVSRKNAGIIRQAGTSL